MNAATGLGQQLAFPMQQPGYEFLTRFEIEAGSRFPLGKAARGRRVIDWVGRGIFDGPRLRGRVIDGADHLIMLPGASVPDVRLGLKTDDGAVIAMRYTGVVAGPKEVFQRIVKREDVDPADYYFRTIVQFECGAPQYDWLNFCVCVGVGQPASFPNGNHGVFYDIHKVV